MDKGLALEFMETIRRLSVIFDREEARLRPILDGKITAAEIRVLVGISRREGNSLGRLADQLGLASGSISPVMRKLVKRGLVVRTVPEGNKRVVNLYLTQAGRKALRLRTDALGRTAEEVLFPLTKKKILLLRSLLETAAQSRP